MVGALNSNVSESFPLGRKTIPVGAISPLQDPSSDIMVKDSGGGGAAAAAAAAESGVSAAFSPPAHAARKVTTVITAESRMNGLAYRIGVSASLEVGVSGAE